MLPPTDMAGFPDIGVAATTKHGVLTLRAGAEPSGSAGAETVQLFVGATSGTSNSIPQMVGPTTPSGAASASSTYSGNAAWFAFSAAQSGWLNNGDGLPVWLKYQFPTPRIISGYGVGPWDLDNFPGRCFSAWKFQGSNDNSAWTDLHEVFSAGTWVVGTLKTYAFFNSSYYLYYRFLVSANGGNAYTGARNVAMYEPGYGLCMMTPTGTRLVVSGT